MTDEDARVDVVIVVCVFRHALASSKVRTTQSIKVEKWEKINPDEVDKVPIERRKIDRRKVLLRKLAALVAEPEPDEDPNAHENVHTVNGRHHEVD